MIGDSNVILVVTSPFSANPTDALGPSLRSTAGVIADLIHDSERELLIATPYLTAEEEYVGGESLYSAMVAASARGVLVRCFFSAEGAIAFSKSGLQAGLRFAEVYVPNKKFVSDGYLGSHAKVVIADGRQAYIGSANLTSPGMHSHLEVGVLVSGKVAEQCRALWTNVLASDFFLRYR